MFKIAAFFQVKSKNIGASITVRFFKSCYLIFSVKTSLTSVNVSRLDRFKADAQEVL